MVVVVTRRRSAGRVDGEAAPAGADLDDSFAGPEVEQAAQAFQLLPGGVLQGCVPGGEHGARVHHRGIEEVFEEVVAQVVVGLDVGAVAVLVGAAEPASGIGDGSVPRWIDDRCLSVRRVARLRCAARS